MKTMKDCREKIIMCLDKLESGDMDIKTVAEMNNGIGKIINTVRTQLEYAKQRKEKPQVDFMKCH